MRLSIPRTLLTLLAVSSLGLSSAFAQAPEAAPSAAPAAKVAPASPAAPTETTEHDTETEALAKETQNPVASLISVPFQSNTYFGVGPHKATAELFKIQPVIPQNVGEWNIIHRTIVPLEYLPFAAITPKALPAPGGGDVGLGDITYTAFFSPAAPGKLIWGVGPAITAPTASHRTLGQGKWNLGPEAVFLTMKGPIVMGALLQQQWSVAGEAGRPNVSSGLVQPFFNYNFKGGWYVSSSPIVTVNWNADRGQKWTVPVGGGFGRVFMMGKQPVNLSAQLYYNAIRPEGAPDWQLRVSFQLMFPTHRK